jgi:8-oxo-dGTP pyrophosphatase MutT (NUDIX family)
MSFTTLQQHPATTAYRDVAVVIDRARCVLMHEDRYLLARHKARRAANRKRWGLPGGRLSTDEAPEACLRRELFEELACRVPHLIELGDWRHRGETHRVFGSELAQRIKTFDEDELSEIGWFTHSEVVKFAKADRLRTGFELAAIAEFERRWMAAR